MKKILILFLVLGISAMLYYLVILSILGFRKDFSLMWLVGGLGFLSIDILVYILQKNHCVGTSKVVSVSFGAFLILIIFFLIIGGMILKAGFSRPDKDADYMIVLGAQVNGTKVSKALKNRLDTAYEYAKENPFTKIIVSGGQGYKEEVTEAEAMKEYLVQKGIQENRIIKEEKSTSTNENILYSKKLVEHAEYVVIVTNRFHLLRGVKIARRQLSQRVEGLGADTGTVLFLNYYVREVFAIVKDLLVGHF